MKAIPGRVVLGLGLLVIGLAAEAAVERASRAERPLLNGPLASIPLKLGDWVGSDVPIDPEIARESQATEYLNRVYRLRGRSGRSLSLWINFSEYGLNMRHSPDVCLPSGGWEKVESMTTVVDVPTTDGEAQTVSLLGYAKDRAELVQRIGFWYYIFGEGRVERLVRQLPITSRSSHGRTTRGSGLTVEVFAPGDTGLSDDDLADFIGVLLEHLEPLLPEDRASYHIP